MHRVYHGDDDGDDSLVSGADVCMYVCINFFKVGQIYVYVNKKHLALQ